MSYKEIGPEELGNAFRMIGKEWMLVTAGDERNFNSMTASWGGMGVMWFRNVVFVVLRPQRYTKEFVDREERFSLSFYDRAYRKALTWMGTVSGRDDKDKMAKSGLTPVMLEGVPAFAEAHTVLICRKLFAQEYDPASFLDPAVITQSYPENDFHTLYVGEVEKVLVRE